MNNTIEWHQAKDFPEQQRNDQQKYIDEFLESNCEIMNGRDLQHYADKTGKGLEWVIDNGKDIHPAIKETFFMTGGMDEVWDFDPITYENENYFDDEDEWSPEEEIEYYADEQHKLFE